MLMRRGSSALWLERRIGSVWNVSLICRAWLFCRERGPSGALFNKIAICRWPETNTDPEQRIEGVSHVSPSVPAEHEFFEIALQMAFSEAVEDAVCPRFQVGEHAVDPVEYVMWPPVSGKLSAALLFLYFSGGRDRTMTWDIHRNEKRLC